MHPYIPAQSKILFYDNLFFFYATSGEHFTMRITHHYMCLIRLLAVISECLKFNYDHLYHVLETIKHRRLTALIFRTKQALFCCPKI